jgi:hypothetical protein
MLSWRNSVSGRQGNGDSADNYCACSGQTSAGAHITVRQRLKIGVSTNPILNLPRGIIDLT